MSNTLNQIQKRILKVAIFVTMIVIFMSCGGSSQKNIPDKFIGAWIEIGSMTRSTGPRAGDYDYHHIKIEKYGDNFIVKRDVSTGNHILTFTASYNKELDKLVVGDLKAEDGTDIIYNPESKTIHLWGFDCKKEEVSK